MALAEAIADTSKRVYWSQNFTLPSDGLNKYTLPLGSGSVSVNGGPTITWPGGLEIGPFSGTTAGYTYGVNVSGVTTVAAFQVYINDPSDTSRAGNLIEWQPGGSAIWPVDARDNETNFPVSSIPIAVIYNNPAGQVGVISDQRPSGITSIPSGVLTEVIADPTKRANLQNNYTIKTDPSLQPRGRVYVGPGSVLLNGQTITWTGTKPAGFYLGPFGNWQTAGVWLVAGQSAVQKNPDGTTNPPFPTIGVAQIYVDATSGLPTWAGAPAAPTSYTTFPTNSLPLAIVFLDSSGGIVQIQDVRPSYR